MIRENELPFAMHDDLMQFLIEALDIERETRPSSLHLDHHVMRTTATTTKIHADAANHPDNRTDEQTADLTNGNRFSLGRDPYDDPHGNPFLDDVLDILVQIAPHVSIPTDQSTTSEKGQMALTLSQQLLPHVISVHSRRSVVLRGLEMFIGMTTAPLFNHSTSVTMHTKETSAVVSSSVASLPSLSLPVSTLPDSACWPSLIERCVECLHRRRFDTLMVDETDTHSNMIDPSSSSHGMMENENDSDNEMIGMDYMSMMDEHSHGMTSSSSASISMSHLEDVAENESRNMGSTMNIHASKRITMHSHLSIPRLGANMVRREQDDWYTESIYLSISECCIASSLGRLVADESHRIFNLDGTIT